MSAYQYYEFQAVDRTLTSEFVSDVTEILGKPVRVFSAVSIARQFPRFATKRTTTI